MSQYDESGEKKGKTEQIRKCKERHEWAAVKAGSPAVRIISSSGRQMCGNCMVARASFHYGFVSFNIKQP